VKVEDSSIEPAKKISKQRSTSSSATAMSLSTSSAEHHGQGQECGGGMTAEEQAVANEIDKEFDDLFDSSSESDEDDKDNMDSVMLDHDGNSDAMEEDDMHAMLSDSDGVHDSSSETESTTHLEEDDDVESGEFKEELSLVVLQSSGKKGVKGHEAIAVPELEHSNLQILFVLEHLTMDNVHTASLLLCKYSVAPVCEIL
jgi:hypothetical protein